MASGIDKRLTKHLECAVCLERFTDPKVLSCQHTYCRECLERLVTVDFQRNDIAEIKCPECREQTEIPMGDVNNLQGNFLINKLLSDLDIHSDRHHFCEKHDDEKLKLFCQTCDLLICRDCILIDHCNHSYKFVKDIYPAEKKKIEKAVEKSRAKIADLEATIKHLDDLEGKAQANCRDVSYEIDAFIDEQFLFLEEKRESLKTELENLAGIQRERRRNLKESLNNTLACVKKDVDLAEQTMKSGHVAKLLATKTKIMTTLTSKVSVPISKSKRRFLISHFLEVNTPLNEEVFKNMATIRKRMEACGTDDGHDDDDYGNHAAAFGDLDGRIDDQDEDAVFGDSDNEIDICYNYDDYDSVESGLSPDQWDDVPAFGALGGDNHDDYAAAAAATVPAAFGVLGGDDHDDYAAAAATVPDVFRVLGGDNYDDYAAAAAATVPAAFRVLGGDNYDNYVDSDSLSQASYPSSI